MAYSAFFVSKPDIAQLALQWISGKPGKIWPIEAVVQRPWWLRKQTPAREQRCVPLLLRLVPGLYLEGGGLKSL